MSSQISENNVVAVRYASALIDMAEEGKVLDKVEKDMLELDMMIESSADLASMIRNPLTGKSQKHDAVMALADKAKFQTLTKNFLGVLIANGRINVITGIVGAMKKELRKRRGEVEAKIQTAYALTSEQTKMLQKQLSDAMGANVTLEVEVNKDLLGGMVVTVGSRMIDDSVRAKLDKLGRSMGASSNENVQLKEVG